MSSGGGGGGQSGTTQYNWNPVIGGMWGDGSNGVLNWANEIAQKPYQAYGSGSPQDRVAGLTGDTYSAMQNIRNMVNSGGPQDTAQARLAAGDIASGGQLDANPYGGMSNPYFDSVLKSGLEDITGAYQNGTAANTNRMFNLSGAFGGSAHQQAVANNENALAKQLGQYTSGMQNQQYDRSAGLYESGLGRQMQAIPLAFQGQALSTDLYNQLMGVGNVNRNYTQQLMDQSYSDWANQMNWGRQNVDWLSNILGRAQGSTGSSTTTSGYGQPNLGSALLGGGLLASTLFGGAK